MKPLLALLGCALVACEAQSPPVSLDAVPLQPALSPVSEAFGHISGIVALDDSLILLVDRDAVAVFLVNWKRGTVAPTGREGSGPGEHQALGTPVPGGPGRALMLDWRQRRVLGFDSSGWANAGDLRTLPLGVDLHGGDHEGNLYFEYRPVSHERGGTSYADSSLIVTLAPEGSIDTIAHVLAPKQVIHVIRSKSGGGRVRSSSMVFDAPYARRDVWAVGPNGEVPILRSDPVRLDVARLGHVARGMAFDLPRVEILSTDRADSLLPVPNEELPPWPEAMPPFEGMARLCGSENGRFIVRRPGHIGDSVQTWLGFFPNRRTADAFSIAASDRVVGCGDGLLYAARTQSDDTERLIRYRLR